MVWISSSCTTHLISKAANKRCSWTSVGRTDKLLSEHTHKHTNTHTDRKSSKSVFEWSSGLTRWSPAPGAVLTHARGRAVLTVPAVLNRCPVSAANGVLVITTGLNIHWLLGNGVLRAKWACELMRLFPDTVLKIIPKKNCVSSPAVCLTDSVLSGVLHLPLLVSMLTAWKSVGQSLYWFIFLIPFHSFFFLQTFLCSITAAYACGMVVLKMSSMQLHVLSQVSRENFSPFRMTTFSRQLVPERASCSLSTGTRRKRRRRRRRRRRGGRAERHKETNWKM